MSIVVSAAHFLVVVVLRRALLRFCLGTGRALAGVNFEFDIEGAAVDDNAGLVMVAGAEIAVCSVSGEILARRVAEPRATSVAVPALREVTVNRFFVTGHANGDVRFWSVDWSGPSLRLIRTEPLGRGPVPRLAFGVGGCRLLAAAGNEIWDFETRSRDVRSLAGRYAAQCAGCRADAQAKPARACDRCHLFMCLSCMPDKVCAICTGG